MRWVRANVGSLEKVECVQDDRIEARHLARLSSAIERDALLSIADFSLLGVQHGLATSTFGWPCRLSPTLPDPVTLSGFAGGLCESRSERTSHAQDSVEINLEPRQDVVFVKPPRSCSFSF